MKPIPLSQAAQRIGATILRPAGDDLADPPVTGVSTDSRTTSAGDLFFALKGPNFDGHDFVAEAMSRGAVGAVVERDLPGIDGLLRVEDTLRALGSLAVHHRRSLPGRVIAVTGSTGKTTVKAMVGTILGREMPVLVGLESFNNEIGVPLTLLGADDSHQAVVIELAMRGPGEIRYLAEMAQPDVGAITNIGPSHIGRLGSLEAIAEAKAELFDAMPAASVGAVNADDLFAPYLLERAEHLGRRVTFGVAAEAEVRAQGVEILGLDGIHFTLIAGGRTAPVRLPIIGRHHVSNALCAAALAHALGMDAGQIAAGLGQVAPQPGRGQLRPVRGGIMLVDDAYNASPISMAAALTALQDLPAEGRRVAVLGDMLELGDWAEESHRMVGRLAAEVGLRQLMAVGELSRWIAEEAIAAGLPGDRVHWFPAADDAAGAVGNVVRRGDVVLVKASRAMRLERVIHILTGEGDDR